MITKQFIQLISFNDLGNAEPFGFLRPMIHFERQIIALNIHCVYVDHNLFEVKPHNKSWVKVMCAFFNSTISILIKELGGRVNLGQGALKTEGIDIEKLFLIHPDRISKKTLGQLNHWIEKTHSFAFRTIFDELGAHEPSGFFLKS